MAYYGPEYEKYANLNSAWNTEEDEWNDPNEPVDENWYFTMVSELNANMPDEFGPYPSFEAALVALNNVMRKTREQEPSIIRNFTQPYQGSRWR
tara:strand:- start:216 stop:497 length:282 start_codon:yes stop_codon:yes gene_type:complete